MKPLLPTGLGICCLCLAASCYQMRQSRGGGQTAIPATRTITPADIALPDGYKIELVAQGLSFPSAICFDASGRPHVVEAGYSYGEVFLQPRLVRIEPDGKLTAVASGEQNGPWTGVDFHNGAFYVAEGGVRDGGRILRIDANGAITPLVSDLPTVGDHHTNGPAIRDGYLYFTLGTATNSGVVGTDNAKFGWLQRHPQFHDIPCRDVTLSGRNFETDNPLTAAAGDKVRTGAFVPFGTETRPGQVIKGQLPCTGAVLRVPVAGGTPELVAWGLRNPFGLCFAPDGRLFITENSYDDRGSRPVWGTGDVLWEIKSGQWYGWPDFAEGRALDSDHEFHPPGKPSVKPVLQTNPASPPKPAALLGVHSSSNHFDFSRTAAFGYQGQAFIAQFGDMAPGVGKVVAPVGFKVVRVDVGTGTVMDFAANKGRRNGPATWLKHGGLERPVAARFDPAGTALYVVDFGILKTTKAGVEPQPKTGVLWRITRQ
jgi:glucose/arabinose dehydrogenase